MVSKAWAIMRWFHPAIRHAGYQVGILKVERATGSQGKMVHFSHVGHFQALVYASPTRTFACITSTLVVHASVIPLKSIGYEFTTVGELCHKRKLRTRAARAPTSALPQGFPIGSPWVRTAVGNSPGFRGRVELPLKPGLPVSLIASYVAPKALVGRHISLGYSQGGLAVRGRCIGPAAAVGDVEAGAARVKG